MFLNIQKCKKKKKKKVASNMTMSLVRDFWGGTWGGQSDSRVGWQFPPLAMTLHYKEHIPSLKMKTEAAIRFLKNAKLLYHCTPDDAQLFFCLFVRTHSLSLCIEINNKHAIFHTVQQPALTSQLFQSGQHQSGHHMVRYQHASFYVGHHRHTCL